MSVLPNSLAFARHSIPTFPIWGPANHHDKLVCACWKGSGCPTPAKHPIAVFNQRKIAPNGHLDGSVEPGVLKLWFGLQVPLANLGVWCKGLIVLDIDPRHNGDVSLRALEAAHGELPATWRVLTGGGGEHIWFRAPIGRRFGSWRASDTPYLGEGIDGRCDDGYVVGVGSRHVSGREYVWSVDHHPRAVEIAPAPDWLTERISTKPQQDRDHPRRAPDTEWQRLTCEITREYRDMAAMRLAGRLVRYHDSLAVQGLMECWNAVRCIPPLEAGELRRLVDEVIARDIKRLKDEAGG